MPQRSAVFFVDLCLPNAEDLNQCLEIGVLRLSCKPDSRPNVFIHSFLNPKNPKRVRWNNAREQGISREFLQKQMNLPTLEQIIEADFLKDRHVVCFDLENDAQEQKSPFYDLTKNSQSIFTVTSLWQRVYADNEKALSCSTLNSMLEFLDLPLKNEGLQNYTPLLSRLFAMSAVWAVLANKQKQLENLENATDISKLNLYWPLPRLSGPWFHGQPKSLGDLSAEDINGFFNDRLLDRLDWFSLRMFVHDWVFRRARFKEINELCGKKEIASFIFNKVLAFGMKLWVLIYYAVYEHRNADAREIALKGGNFLHLSASVCENFSGFIIKHLDDFLSPEQKFKLIEALFSQSLSFRDNQPFEHFDYESLVKSSEEGPKRFFNEWGPHVGKFKCVREIRSAQGQILFRGLEISGNKEERGVCIEFVNKYLHDFMTESANPFSEIWVTTQFKLWAQFITGVPFADIVKVPKMNDTESLTKLRRQLREIMDGVLKPYRIKLRNHLSDAIGALNRDLAGSANGDNDYRFNFMGINVELEFKNKVRDNFFKRLLKFR